MRLIQFWRTLWAGRLLILWAAICCLSGGVAVIAISPPRWTAQARVFLNILKPDPVTGQFMDRQTQSYVATQIELITDYTVAGLTVDKLGWLSEPALIQQYQRRSRKDTRDFRHWLAQIITDRTRAQIEGGSNILSISYTGTTPESAKAVTNALLQSYLDTSLAFRRADANKSADWYGLQAQRAKASLEEAETTLTSYERQSGVVLTQDGKTDVDSARLTSMALSLRGNQVAENSGSEALLAETNAEIKSASAAMGPNNPQILALQAKRAGYAALVARENAATRPGAPGGSRLDAQKALVFSQSSKLAKLKILQSEVEIGRSLFNKTSQKEADFRQQAAVTNAGLIPLTEATVPASPSFPNVPLIIAGSLALGILNGGLLAVLVELLNRRVRGREDLLSVLNLPVLAIVGIPR